MNYAHSLCRFHGHLSRARSAFTNTILPIRPRHNRFITLNQRMFSNKIGNTVQKKQFSIFASIGGIGGILALFLNSQMSDAVPHKKDIKTVETKIEKIKDSKSLTLDILFDKKQKINFNGTEPRIMAWLRDGIHYVEMKKNSSGKSYLAKVTATTGEFEPLYNFEKIISSFSGGDNMENVSVEKMVTTGDFKFSPDENAVMITYNNDLYYYHFVKNEGKRLTQSGEKSKINLREPSFSPDGKKIAFIRDWDLHFVEIETVIEQDLTTGGHENLMHGVLDWVYQEELYGRGDYKAYWWSPDSSRIAFLELDESPVPSFTVIDHMPQHLSTEITRYPKSGDPNPIVRLGMIDVSDSNIRWVETTEDEDLVVRVGWSPNGEQLIYQIQNREQTWLKLLTHSITDWESNLLLEENNENGWVEILLDEPKWLQDNSFLWLSERTGYSHLYHYSSDGETECQLTSGEWEVMDLYGVNEEKGKIYFAGAHWKGTGIEKEIFGCNLDGTNVQRISNAGGWHSANFNSNMSMFINSFSSMTSPTETKIISTVDGNCIRDLPTLFDPVVENYKNGLIKPEFIKVTTKDEFELEGLLIKPPNFDPSKKYPVLYYQYSGPHCAMMMNRWWGKTALWLQMLAQQGYVIFQCDCRTSSSKGACSTWPVYKNFGRLEMQDIDESIDWLCSQSYIDNDRIGIFGWSYGGYMTLYALTHSDRFKVGIAGAPVTDWELYDTIYTERYMGTPQKNPSGYRVSSVLNCADKLSGNLFLIHGTMDDNVHFQQSVQFIEKLQNANKQFQFMAYPSSRHGVTDSAQLHLHTAMTEHLQRHL